MPDEDKPIVVTMNISDDIAKALADSDTLRWFEERLQADLLKRAEEIALDIFTKGVSDV